MSTPIFVPCEGSGLEGVLLPIGTVMCPACTGQLLGDAEAIPTHRRRDDNEYLADARIRNQYQTANTQEHTA